MMWSSSAPMSQIPDTSHHDTDEEYIPPSKKQKQKKGNWSEKNMTEAVNSCKNQELGIEEAALLYGVPKRSLRTKLKDKNFSVIDDKYRVFVLPVFPAQAEADLVECLQDLISSQLTFTSLEVRRLAYELVSEKYHLSNLPQENDCLLGKRWYKSFISKYPHLETENPPPNAYQRKSAAFFNALESLIARYEVDASRIFSVDGIELKFRASNSDDFDKIFHRRKIIYTDAKAICCISPSGLFVPPVFIKPQEKTDLTSESCQRTIESIYDEEPFSNEFQGHTIGVDDNAFSPVALQASQLGPAYDKLKELCNSNIPILPTPEDIANIKKQIKTHLNKKLQPMSEENEEELREKLYEQFNQLRNKIVSRYESTLNVVSNEMFYGWLQNFINYVKPNPQQKTLLLLADQSYIKLLRTFELANAHGIKFLILPPHSVHKIHPLDGFTMSLNRNLSTCASTWLGKNPDFKIQQVPLHLLFKKAYTDTVNPSIAKNGFLYSGIWPVNRHIFESTELGGESLLRCNAATPSLAQYIGPSQGSANSQNNSTTYGMTNVTKEIDVSKLCRICMKDKMYMKPLFDSLSPSVVNYHGRKISEMTSIPISPDDGLPGSICQYCLVQLMDAIKIRNITVESNKKQLKLREALDRLFFEDEESNKDKILLSHFQYDNSSHIQPKVANKVLTKNFDINSICRICMGEKPLMTSLFYKPQGESKFYVDTFRKVAEVSQCQVHINDGLSSSICPFCRASINQASELIQKVLSSDKRFREILSQM